MTEKKIGVSQYTKLEERLAALHTNAAKLALSDDLHEIYEIVLETADSVLGFTFAGVAVRDGNIIYYPRTRRSQVPEDWVITVDDKSVVSRTFRTGETQIVADVNEDPDFMDAPEDYDLPKSRSEITVPIHVHGEVAAVINIESPGVNEFKEDDRLLLEILAQHTSSALTRIREAESRRQYEDRLRALHSHAVELNTARTLQEIYGCTLKAMVETFGYERVDILRVQGDTLTQVAKHGGIPTGVNLPLDGAGITVKAVKEKRSVLVNDISHSSDYVYASDEDGTPFYGYEISKAELVSPLIVDGEAVGVLNIESRQPFAFTELDRQHLEILASHVATAIDRVSKLEEVETLNEEQNRVLIEGFKRVSSMARHDLRGPLQNIMSAVYLLKKNPGNKRMYEIIEQNIRLADDIMENWSELTLTGDISRATVDVGSLVDEVLKGIMVPENIETRVTVPEKIEFELSRRGIMRVLGNLVTNSIEAMPDGGELGVGAHLERGWLVIEVSDTGEGIPVELKDKMFTPFTTSKPRGVGLGLAYVKENVEAHGGTVTYTSEPGEGTTFTIRIPGRKPLVLSS
ncbi:GAF domain-containing protein [Candidatus Bathyarchaeota archaeon]|nr:GAF domain-containing protein [Candidatus Bathyarchaeota archaeon]